MKLTFLALFGLAVISFGLPLRGMTAQAAGQADFSPPTGSTASTLPGKDKLPAAVSLSAIPFDLSDIRLLDSPFKHAEDLDREYLLKLEPDRFLAWFRKEAGLDPKASVYGGWESRGIAGHSLGHYLSACALMYESTGDPALSNRVAYVVSELAACRNANGNGYVGAIPKGKEIFARVARGDISSNGFDLNGGWVPWYTMHKVFAGLRDAYTLCGNAQALAVMRGLGDWAIAATKSLDDAQWQRMLACEHGGMNEVMADLYALTGEQKYLDLSRKFHQHAVLDALTAGRDELNGKHANTQIPKLIGLARRYELTGDDGDRAAAAFFWDRVVHHHSYVTGGHCLNEHFGPPDRLNDRLGPHTTETCNVYNMLKLTQHVFEWQPSAAAGDFYERALFNHILSSQHPDNGRVVYDLSLAMGGVKDYQTRFDSFTCCVGTGMENHAKYREGIYFHATNTLYVNLFIASELKWKEKGLVLRQETRFPDADTPQDVTSFLESVGQRPETRFPDTETVKLTFKSAPLGKLALRIRRPYWAESGFQALINGKLVESVSKPSSFLELNHEWNTGDVIELKLPMTLRLESMPDNTNRVAVMYGPIVLAGELGPPDDPAAAKSDYVPVLVTEGRPPTAWCKADLDIPLAFHTEGVGKPRDVLLYPFFRMHDKHYTVYWDIFTASQWASREAAYKLEREQERELATRTVDSFQVGEMQPERDHNVLGEHTSAGEAFGRKWRHATDGGWFSFEMKVPPAGPANLVITYWGGDGGNREFDIVVNGEKVATQRLENNHPNRFFDATYLIPEKLMRDKTKITVKFQAHPNCLAGGIFGARLIKAGTGG